MAETVHLYLKANGTDIPGESVQAGREGSIECVYYEQKVATDPEAKTSPAGRRLSHYYEPLIIRKPIDQSSPLLVKALINGEAIDGTFRFFRPNPSGDGTTEQFYTVEIKKGRVSGIKQIVPSTFGSASEPPLEEVQFVFHTISWTYTNSGATHEDVLSANAAGVGIRPSSPSSPGRGE